MPLKCFSRKIQHKQLQYLKHFQDFYILKVFFLQIKLEKNNARVYITD